MTPIPLVLGRVLLAVATAWLAACAPAPAARAPAGEPDAGSPPVPGAVVFKGTLASGAHTPLPPEAGAIVEVRDALGPEGQVIGERRIDLRDRKLPVSFELPVEGSRLADGGLYRLRGALHVGGRPVWSSEFTLVQVRAGTVQVGALRMVPAEVEGHVSELRCGDVRATIGYVRDTTVLRVAGDRFELRPVRVASGARYEAVGELATFVWDKGPVATLVVRGVTYPECSVLPAEAPRLRARGNEPGWAVDIEGPRTRFTMADGGGCADVPTPPAVRGRGTLTYDASAGPCPLRVTVEARLCVDTMTGVPHPAIVRVDHEGRRMTGCGGDPAALLRGPEWVVEDIDGRGVVDRSRPALVFGPDGEVFGRASCNSFRGRYALSGEALTVSDLAGTRMACARSVMAQEQAFFATLRVVSRFELAADGALVLVGPDGRSLRARRA